MKIAANALILVAVALFLLAGERPQAVSSLGSIVRLNLRAESLFSLSVTDSLLAAEQDRSVAERIGLWARRFLADPDSEYRFGPEPGGYTHEGLLVSDHRQDCVSLCYRATELARAGSAPDAILIALRTRFAGADPDSVADSAGRVDYDRGEHLDFSIDMIRSGLWGRDITGSLPGTMPDSIGTSRYRPFSFSWLPKDKLDPSLLREGDIVWLVLDPARERTRQLRESVGLVIGHLGILIEEAGELHLVHAASSDLEGEYEGGRVVSVALATYLRRVDAFGGLMITRFD